MMNKETMNKTLFLQLMTAVVEQQKTHSRWNDFYWEQSSEALGNVAGVDVFVSDIVNAIESALETDLVGWWLWDAPEAGKNGQGCMTIGGLNIDIITPADLWAAIHLKYDA